mmetsp:Transcript_171/g.404  ORF Transcript_171/g.404 Transcript_171/m.404 type:complete len:255 (+) Transcript_171:602-1366(+)
MRGGPVRDALGPLLRLQVPPGRWLIWQRAGASADGCRRRCKRDAAAGGRCHRRRCRRYSVPRFSRADVPHGVSAHDMCGEPLCDASGPLLQLHVRVDGRLGQLRGLLGEGRASRCRRATSGDCDAGLCALAGADMPHGLRGQGLRRGRVRDARGGLLRLRLRSRALNAPAARPSRLRLARGTPWIAETSDSETCIFSYTSFARRAPADALAGSRRSGGGVVRRMTRAPRRGAYSVASASKRPLLASAGCPTDVG